MTLRFGLKTSPNYSLNYKNPNDWKITKDYKTLEELVSDKDSFINEVKEKEKKEKVKENNPQLNFG